MHGLIIEDIPVVALAIEDELRDLGFLSFDFVGSKADAVAAAEAHCPDLIIADYRLIDGTGVDAVREICRTRNIPTIYVAALADEVLRDEPTAIVLEKPIASNALTNAVRARLQLM